jgi:hypothetical protein
LYARSSAILSQKNIASFMHNSEKSSNFAGKSEKCYLNDLKTYKK